MRPEGISHTSLVLLKSLIMKLIFIAFFMCINLIYFYYIFRVYYKLLVKLLVFMNLFICSCDRNVIIGVALFRRAGVRHRMSDESISQIDGADVISRTSLDSGGSHPDTTNIDSSAYDRNKTGM